METLFAGAALAVALVSLYFSLSERRAPLRSALFERRFDAYLKADEQMYGIVHAIRDMEKKRNLANPDEYLTAEQRVLWNREVLETIDPRFNELTRLMTTRRLVITNEAAEAMFQFIVTLINTARYDSELRIEDVTAEAGSKVAEVLARELGVEGLSRETLRLLNQRPDDR